jgi:hypothetical protein
MSDASVDEVVARLRDEIEEYVNEHVVGVQVVDERTLMQTVAYAEGRMQSNLGPEFTVRALNPRLVDGRMIVWDGYLIERRFDA